MIRIISSRKFRLYSPDRSENIVTEGKNIIQEIPEWAIEDEMFKVAKNAGLIQILSSRSVEKVAENAPEQIVPQNAHEEAPVPQEEPEEETPMEEPEEAAKKVSKKAARAARRSKREQ